MNPFFEDVMDRLFVYVKYIVVFVQYLEFLQRLT
jgi:hypothetical protein